MMNKWGIAMGEEFYGMGANVQLGPGVCVARVPRNGKCSKTRPTPFFSLVPTPPTTCLFDRATVRPCGRAHTPGSRHATPTHTLAHIVDANAYAYPTIGVAVLHLNHQTGRNFEYVSGEDPFLGFSMVGDMTPYL